jgi:hypothetical protein
MPILIMATFTIDEIWDQPRFTPAPEWIMKMYTHNEAFGNYKEE